MKVEVLYVADCPSHAPALAMLAAVLAEEGIAPDIHQVLVRDEAMAREWTFRGSPTIRIDGRDVEGEPATAASFAVCCRLYHGSPRPGVPPVAMVRRAVRAARRQGEES
ncbi:MAG TPA: hypothetical protein VOA80_20940 [Thermoanaerobaculia bacterium]|nr:hypothetical protein [Thermoanaerobaculia bacterium]